MAMNGNTMGTAMFNAVKAAAQAQNVVAEQAISDPQLEAIWKAAAGAIVQHITSNAITTTPGAQSGLLTLPGTVA